METAAATEVPPAGRRRSCRGRPSRAAPGRRPREKPPPRCVSRSRPRPARSCPWGARPGQGRTRQPQPGPRVAESRKKSEPKCVYYVYEEFITKCHPSLPADREAVTLTPLPRVLPGGAPTLPARGAWAWAQGLGLGPGPASPPCHLQAQQRMDGGQKGNPPRAFPLMALLHR